MSGASRDVGKMAEEAGKVEQEADQPKHVENETSDGPHQTLASALNVPEVQPLDRGSQSSDEGCPLGTGHDPIDDPHQCLLKEGADDTNARCNSSDGSQEDDTHDAADETQQVLHLLEQSSLETKGLMEEPETSNVGVQEVTTAEDVGRLDISECLQQDCVSAPGDRDGETGGLMYDGSRTPQSVHDNEETSHKVSEDDDTEQVQEKSPEQRNIEASASETKIDEIMDTDPEQPEAAGVEHDDQKEVKDDASDNALEDSGDFPGISSVATNVSPPLTPVQREEDVTAESLHTKRKHVFVLSEAGKPIYSRYGNEEALSSNMGVMMALVSFVQSGNNIIRSIHSEKQKVVFLQQGPLVLVSVSRAPQSEEQLRMELQYVYYQIISMLTQASVARIFERKKNYDLRRLLAGSEKILDSLLDLLDTDPGFLLGAVRCVALPSPLRDSLSSILTKAITPNLVFSILVAEQQLVTVVQERAVIEDCRLDPADLHLLLNLIGASSAFQAGEIWTPICLPRFNPDGYFYAYISYLDPDCTVCLVLLSTDKESFYAVSDCKKKIQEAMEAQNSLQTLAGALRCCSYSVSLVGVPELLHFVYKPLDIPDPYRQLPQFTSPEPDGPYSNEEEKQRLFDLYRYLHCRIHNSARPLRLIYHVAEKETLLAWVTSKFELYTSFSSLVTKVGAINVITKLLRWIKREEDRLFIRYPPKYSTTPVPGKGVKSSRTDRTDPSQNGFFTGL